MKRRLGFRGPAAALRRRAALGLRPFTAPVAVFIPLGLAAGPTGAGIISRQALSHLDIVVTLALAALGVFVGVAGAREGPPNRRLFAAATVEAAFTLLMVAGAVLLLLIAWDIPIGLSAVVAALALGVSAAASAAPGTPQVNDREHEIAARVADLDDVLPIVFGAVVLGMAAPGSPSGAAALIAIAVGLGIAACGWLLLERAQDQAERGVFVLGSIALLGGSAAYLDTSPLLSGMAAGSFWVVAPGHSDRLMQNDLNKIQHPLVVLLLIIAGASIEPTLLGIWLLAPYVTFRICGKVIGGWMASRVAPHVAPSGLGSYLIPPGVLGIAFALNFAQTTAGTAPIVCAVGLGAVACEVLALFLVPAQGSA